MEHSSDKLTDHPRKTRSDGAQSRERLLLAAMRLFAERGFATTSTREIALAAGTNVASIAYYFGDKAGLYRAAYSELAPCPAKEVAAFTDPDATLREALRAFYAMLLGHLRQGELAQVGIRLWLREMLEPTGLWRAEIDNGIKPAHEGLVLMLARHLGVGQPGDDVARLAFCVGGLALQLMVTRDVIDQLAPQLLDSDAALDTWMARLVDYAEAMVNAEQARQVAAAPTKKSLPRKKNKA
jgi:AcrR family transcriptional regulator